MSKSVDKLIEDYMRRREWTKARAVISKALRTNKNDHWLITRLATTHYEEHQYRKALRLEERALRLAPRCPLALWDHASTLDMLGQESKAIAIWKRLLTRGEEDVAYGECGEGIRWARSLLNDSRYRIAKAYRDIKNDRMAERYFKEHLKNRQPGIPSLYKLKAVKKDLSDLKSRKLRGRHFF
jgi:tetratricopeptide (TPR) repeat protein